MIGRGQTWVLKLIRKQVQRYGGLEFINNFDSANGEIFPHGALARGWGCPMTPGKKSLYGFCLSLIQRKHVRGIAV